MNYTSPTGLSVDTVRAARARIADAVVHTPTLPCEGLSRATGADIYVKFENLQHTGAFKSRGALAKLTTLTPAQCKAGVIAASAGNHAQGVAFHSKRLGIPATIVMPKGTPLMKIRKTRAYGAKVVLEGNSFDEAAAAAEIHAAAEGLTLVHPYNDDEVIAGQGSIAFEMLEAVPDLDVLVIPIGGGGLIAGCALAAKSVKPTIEIVGVEPVLYPSMTNALQGQQKPCTGSTIAEGIAVRDIGQKSVPIVRELVRRVVTVTETSIERAMAMFLTLAKTVAEGAGAAGLAAVLEHPEKFTGRKVGILLSGGNADARLLSSVLMRDLVRSGQVLTLLIEMPDKPGELHRIAGILAEFGANVLEIQHGRFAMDLSASAARLGITIETRDEEHAREVMNALRTAGFTLTVRDPNAPS